MNFKAMNMFVSEESINKHLEHLRSYRLRLSILEKSLPELKGKEMWQIIRSGLGREVKEEALGLHWYIRAHECFFNSFTEAPKRSELINKYYSSRERFVYDLYLEAMKKEYGFLFVYIDRGVPKRVFATAYDRALIKFSPILALDLYEHTYFSDYGFSKDRFLRAALMYFDTARLDDIHLDNKG